MTDELEIPCPNGCQPNGTRERFCLLCSNTGWVHPSVGQLYRKPDPKPIQPVYTKRSFTIIHIPHET